MLTNRAATESGDVIGGGGLASWQTSLAAWGRDCSVSLTFIKEENRAWNTAPEWNLKEKKKKRKKKKVEKLPGKQWTLIFHWFFCLLIVAECKLRAHPPILPADGFMSLPDPVLSQRMHWLPKTAVSRGLLWARMKTFHTLVLMEKTLAHPVVVMLIQGTPCW